MGQLFTIGHSLHDFEYFAAMLKNNKINYLLDVRSTPYSKYAETYNRKNLTELLKKKISRIHIWESISERGRKTESFIMRTAIWIFLRRHGRAFCQGNGKCDIGARKRQ